jgi:hypothetical protein
MPQIDAKNDGKIMKNVRIGIRVGLTVLQTQNMKVIDKFGKNSRNLSRLQGEVASSMAQKPFNEFACNRFIQYNL